MNIVAINAANHEIRGEWCSCGETVKDCYILFLVTASHKWKEMQYELLFK